VLLRVKEVAIVNLDAYPPPVNCCLGLIYLFAINLRFSSKSLYKQQSTFGGKMSLAPFWDIHSPSN